MSADLAAFLLQRIAEEEAIARSVPIEETPSDSAEDWELWTSLVSTTPRGERLGPRGSVEATPARVLAECEARRRIVELHDVVHECPGGPNLVSDPSFQDGDYGGPCASLCLLALPYVDHPDFDPSWRL